MSKYVKKTEKNDLKFEEELAPRIFSNIAENVYGVIKNKDGEDDRFNEKGQLTFGVNEKSSSLYDLKEAIEDVITELLEDDDSDLIEDEVTPFYIVDLLHNATTWDNYFDHLKFMSRGVFLRLQEGRLSIPITTHHYDQVQSIADILYGVGLDLRNERRYPAKSYGWEDWDYCQFCWRIAPSVKIKRKRRGRCSVHEDLFCKATRNARTLLNAKESHESINQKTLFYKLYNEIRSHKSFRVKGKNHFTSIASDETITLHPNKIKRLNFDLAKTWQVFHHTAEYALKRGANLNDFESVIRSIDDQSKPSKYRDNIHKSYGRDPSLATRMLLLSETWLRLGKTERRGGRRPGAGRKPKLYRELGK